MIALVIALASDAKVLLLDEPYTGLDPVNRAFFYQVLKKYYFNEEKTVIISSHMITEIEGYFENTIILDKGRIRLNETLEDLYKKNFTVEGNDAVMKYLKDRRRVLDIESMMGIHKLFIHDELSSDDVAFIEDNKGTVNGMDLQTFMIKLVTSEEVLV